MSGALASGCPGVIDLLIRDRSATRASNCDAYLSIARKTWVATGLSEGSAGLGPDCPLHDGDPAVVLHVALDPF